MKKIICLVITLLMTLPAYAKLTAHEEARINAMLEGLAQKKDLIFVRNGDEHTCDEAVSHLRLKLGNTRNRIDTAEQFIDKVASSSSITGKPYIVKIPGKSDENAQPFLHALIAQLQLLLCFFPCTVRLGLYSPPYRCGFIPCRVG